MSIEYPCVHFDKGKCKKFSDDKVTSWCIEGPCVEQMLSNADRIRAMSDEDLAEFLIDLADDGNLRIREWLQQPAEEDDND